jgi:hypothetical protein
MGERPDETKAVDAGSYSQQTDMARKSAGYFFDEVAPGLETAPVVVSFHRRCTTLSTAAVSIFTRCVAEATGGRLLRCKSEPRGCFQLPGAAQAIPRLA